MSLFLIRLRAQYCRFFCRCSFLSLFLCALFIPVQAADSVDISDLVAKYGTAVVNISTTQSGQLGAEEEMLLELLKPFGGALPQRAYRTRSLGSGFLISENGHILTNSHIVDGADTITVKLMDRREFKATLVGADKRSDVALLKIEAQGLPKVAIGDPEKLRVGERVFAIGSPFGLDNTVTAGIVSAKGRALSNESYVPYIQTDAAINVGNSGGPLFNLRGEVIGINSQMYSRTGNWTGVGFAIPVDLAMNVSRQLGAEGRVRYGRLGVTIQEVKKEIAVSLGLDKTVGALVSMVEVGSAAAKAGLKAGDIITTYRGKPISHSSDLQRMVAFTKPGTTVVIRIWRDRAYREIPVIVGELQDTTVNGRLVRRKGMPRSEALPRLGVELAELSPARRTQLGIAYGLLVLKAYGPAADAGLQEEDIIIGIGNEPLKSQQQLTQAIAQLALDGTIALLVRRESNTLFFAVQLSDK